eukprot:TRINITY_DN22755_c0_g1_i1.p1 TRINITY_DN22755_c0_g1~~TRINITY_DN22755_c0_g1_i1.p1  ORF type:complete len:439 (+),score=72.93 TRINITY_DN22755_c0_g1_i1:62-1378(+)
MRSSGDGEAGARAPDAAGPQSPAAPQPPLGAAGPAAGAAAAPATLCRQLLGEWYARAAPTRGEGSSCAAFRQQSAAQQRAAHALFETARRQAPDSIPPRAPAGPWADGSCWAAREDWAVVPAAASRLERGAAAGLAWCPPAHGPPDLLGRARAAAARALGAAARPRQTAQRPTLLGQQLRAAAAELWALPAVEQHCRAATVLAEWAARGGLTVLLERDARATAATEVLLRRPAPVRLGPDGILRLQDADGEWKSKSQWRRKYKGNRMWNKVLHRSRRQTEHAVTVHRRRSKKAQQAFRINAIAYCIASYARNKWAIVCRGTAIGWIPMAQYRARCWFWEMCALGSDRGSIHGFVTLDIFVNASSDLQDFKDNLRASPDDWAAKSELMHRAEACQCIFDYFRIQSLDMARDAIRNWVAADTRCRSLRRILSIPPSMAAR